MNKNVLERCRVCLPFQRSKISPEKIEVPNLDIVVMPLQQNYRYCLTMIDRFTRWPEAVPLSNITAETIATMFWTHWISRFGYPKTITMDQGTQFESALFKHLANLAGSKHIHTTAYHPQSNGNEFLTDLDETVDPHLFFKYFSRAHAKSATDINSTSYQAKERNR